MALAPGFVKTDGTRFVVAGEEFPVAGVNCYFLSYCSDEARRDALATIQAVGANVIRSWAFLNFRERPVSGPSFQYASGRNIIVNEGPDGLSRLDGLIAAAEEQEFRLILPLVNYWDDLGGMRTYLDWLFPGQNLSVDEFYRRPEARTAFKNWIGGVLNRVNSRTNLAYRDSPAIFAWELANEPRCQMQGGRELLLNWTRDIAGFIKGQDVNHLVALGDEGFLRRDRAQSHLYTGQYGVDFEATLGVPDIDFGCYHFYPAAEQMNVPLAFGRTWITDHIEAGRHAGKPVLLEEYGIKIGDYDVRSNAERDEWYATWRQTVYESGGAGDLLWMMGSREASVAGNADDYTIYAADEIPSFSSNAAGKRMRLPRFDT
jgi:mannan endo-1,4-beta-mannosidase